MHRNQGDYGSAFASQCLRLNNEDVRELLLHVRGDALFEPAIFANCCTVREHLVLVQGGSLLRPKFEARSSTLHTSLVVVQGGSILEPLIQVYGCQISHPLVKVEGGSIQRPRIELHNCVINSPLIRVQGGNIVNPVIEIYGGDMRVQHTDHLLRIQGGSVTKLKVRFDGMEHWVPHTFVNNGANPVSLTSFANFGLRFGSRRGRSIMLLGAIGNTLFGENAPSSSATTVTSAVTYTNPPSISSSINSVNFSDVLRRDGNSTPRMSSSARSRFLDCLDDVTFKDGIGSTVCAICLEDYVDGAVLKILPCAHRYHSACIKAWLDLNRLVCPECRTPLQLHT